MAKKSKESAIAEVKRRITPVAEVTPYARVLLYGRNGSRKTRTAATGPKHLIIDVDEEGTLSVKDYPGVDVFFAKTWQDIVWVYWFLRSGEHEYESFSIDTITNMQTLCLTQTIKDSYDRDPLRDPAMPAGKDYQKVNNLMKKHLLYFRNLPMHCVFIAQEKTEDSDDEMGEALHVPDLSPGARGTAMACVNFIGHMRVKKVKTTNKKTKKEKTSWKTLMLIGPHDNYITKDRSFMLGQVVIEPNMSQIIEAAKHIREDDE